MKRRFGEGCHSQLVGARTRFSSSAKKVVKMMFALSPGSNNPRTTYKIPEWKKTPPTDEEKAAGSKKKVKNNWYYWCPIHKRWTFHNRKIVKA